MAQFLKHNFTLFFSAIFRALFLYLFFRAISETCKLRHFRNMQIALFPKYIFYAIFPRYFRNKFFYAISEIHFSTLFPKNIFHAIFSTLFFHAIPETNKFLKLSDRKTPRKSRVRIHESIDS